MAGDVSGAWDGSALGSVVVTQRAAPQVQKYWFLALSRSRELSCGEHWPWYTRQDNYSPWPPTAQRGEERGADARHNSGKQQTTMSCRISCAGAVGEEEEEERGGELERIGAKRERESVHQKSRSRKQKEREGERGANSQSQGQFPWVVSGQPSVWLSRCLKWQWLDLYFPHETPLRSINQRKGGVG